MVRRQRRLTWEVKSRFLLVQAIYRNDLGLEEIVVDRQLYSLCSIAGVLSRALWCLIYISDA